MPQSTRRPALLPRALAALCLLPLAAACTTLPARERSYDPSLCNRGAAYEAGFNDGQEGRAMSSSFLDSCRDDLRAQGQEGYRTGYEGGRQRFDERMRAMAEQQRAQQGDPQPASPPALPPAAINIGGGGYSEAPAPNPRAWYCSVHAFMSDFEAFGPTRMEAHQMAIQNCTKQYHAMHCQDVKCQPNQ